MDFLAQLILKCKERGNKGLKIIEEIGGLKVHIYKRSNARRLYVRVNYSDGRVCVNAPSRCSMRTIRKFILDNLSDIEAVRVEVLEKREDKNYLTGEILPVFGKPYKLEVLHGRGQAGAEIEDEKIRLTVPTESTRERREGLILDLYRRQMDLALKDLIAKCQNKTGLKADKYTVRNMKSRWGSCNPKRRTISLNLHLAKYPKQYLEYVIIHELAHLLVANHGPDFYDLMDRFCPDWKEIRKAMRKIKPY